MKKENFVLDPFLVDEALQNIKNDAEAFKNYLDRFISILKSYTDVIFSFISEVYGSKDKAEFERFVDKFYVASFVSKDKDNQNIIIPFWVKALSENSTYKGHENLFIEFFVKNKRHRYFRDFDVSIRNVSRVFENRFLKEIGGQKQDSQGTQNGVNSNTKKETIKKLIRKLDDFSYISWFDVLKSTKVDVSDRSVGRLAVNVSDVANNFGNIFKDFFAPNYLVSFINNLKINIVESKVFFRNDVFDLVCALDYLYNKYSEFFGYDKEKLRSVLSAEPFLYFALVKKSDDNEMFSKPTKNDKIKDYNVKDVYKCFLDAGSELGSIKTFRSLVLNNELGSKDFSFPILNSPHLSAYVRFDVSDGEVAVKFYKFGMDEYYKIEYPVLCMFFALLFHDDIEVVRKFYVFISFVELVFVLIFLAELLFIKKVRLLGLDLNIETAVADNGETLKRYIRRIEPNKRYIKDDDVGKVDEVLEFYEGDEIIRSTMFRFLLDTYQTFWGEFEERASKTKSLSELVSTKHGQKFLSFYKDKYLTTYTNTGLYRFVLSMIDRFFNKVVGYARHPIFLRAGIKILDDEDLRSMKQNQRNIKNGSFDFLLSSSFSKSRVDFFKTWVCTTADVLVSSFIQNLSFVLPKTMGESGAVSFFRNVLKDLKTLYPYLWRALGKVGGGRASYL